MSFNNISSYKKVGSGGYQTVDSEKVISPDYISFSYYKALQSICIMIVAVCAV